MLITLKTDSNIAVIDSVGAELISLKDGFNTEYMWQKDPKYWARTSPVLFPIVGNLHGDTMLIDGREYKMEKHGFCRDAEFTVESQSKTRAVFSYCANEKTLAQYPFHFKLSLSYMLESSGLTILYTVSNLGDAPMDYCLGAHPAFNVPVEGKDKFEDYCLTFEKEETAGCPVYDLEKLQFDMENRVDFTKGSRKLPLNYNDFDNDAIFFDQPSSKRVKLESVKSGRGVEVNYEGFDFIAFWTPIKQEAPFLCVEPWSGCGACSDEGQELAKKRGVTHLEPGEEHEHRMIILPI